MSDIKSQHPASVRARRIEELKEQIRDKQGLDHKEIKDNLILYARRHWGVSRQTAQDYADSVLISIN